MKLSKEVAARLDKHQKRYYKLYGKLPPNDPVQIATPTIPPLPTTDKLTVLCVRFGNKYGPDYVERLRNMVSRHLTIPYEFACLTDDPKSIEGVTTVYQRGSGYMRPWWHKVHMFDPNLGIRGRILYFDLDVIICNNINKLVEGLKNNEFYSIQDFNRKFHPNWKQINSSVMTWVHGTQGDIWNKFSQNPVLAQRMHGDQDWIWHCAKDKIKFWPREWIQSYKWEIRSREELVIRTGKNGFKTIAKNPTIHSECAVAVFHGDPKPEQVPDAFVLENWK